MLHLYFTIPVKACVILNYCRKSGVGVASTCTLGVCEGGKRQAAPSSHNKITHGPRWLFPESMWSVAMGMVQRPTSAVSVLLQSWLESYSHLQNTAVYVMSTRVPIYAYFHICAHITLIAQADLVDQLIYEWSSTAYFCQLLACWISRGRLSSVINVRAFSHGSLAAKSTFLVYCIIFRLWCDLLLMM